MKLGKLMPFASLIVLGLLILPVLAIDNMNDTQIDIITSREGFNYYPISTNVFEPITFESHFPTVNVLGTAPIPRSVLVGFLGGNAKNLEYSDNLIYLGDNTYKLDTSVYTTFTTYNEIFIPIDLYPAEISEYDFVIVECTNFTQNTNMDIFVYKSASSSTDRMYDFNINPDEKVFYNPTSDDALFESYIEENAYLSIKKYNLALPFDENITFSISYALKDPGNSTVTIDDNTQYLIIITSSIVINAVAIIFMTDRFDILIDKRNQRKY